MIKRASVFIFLLWISFFFNIQSLAADELKQVNILKAAIPGNFPPHYLVDNEGQPYGLAIEMMDQIAALAGYQIQYDIYNGWPEANRALFSGMAHITPNMGITKERLEKVFFTDPIDVFNVGLFVREKSSIRNLADLHGLTIGVVKQNVGVRLVGDIEQAIAKLYDHPENALLDLLRGKVDGLIYPVPVIWKMLDDLTLEGKLKVLEPPLLEVKRGTAINKQYPLVKKRLQKAVDQFIGSDAYKKILSKWYGAPTPYWTTLKVLGLLATMMLLTIVIAMSIHYRSTLLINRHLKRETKLKKRVQIKLERLNRDLDQKVAHRTADLEETNNKLIKSEQFINSALNSSLTGIYIYNLIEGRNSFINDRYTRLTGYTYEDLDGLKPEEFQSLFHPQDTQRIKDHIANVVNGTDNNPLEVEYRFRNKQGEWIWLFSQDIAFQRNDQQQVTEFIGSFVDITKRKQDEQKLYQAAAVFSSTAEGIAITDANVNIIDVNQSFCKITGYSKEEAIGKNPNILQSGRHSKEFYQSMWKSLIEEDCWQGEIWNRNKQGHTYPELLTINSIKDDKQQLTGYLAVFSDISAMKQSQQRLDYLAHHDALTNLPNRLLFNERLEHAVNRAGRHHNLMAILFVDLDLFKNVNDSLGHQYGDELLKQVSKRLSESIRTEDTLARISGDEFVVMLESIATVDVVAVVVDKIMDAFSEPFSLIDSEIRMTCSVGISLYPEDGDNPSQLLKNADAAMYRAKEEGRNTYQFYTEEMTAVATEHVIVENALRNALLNEELLLVYQPQFRLINKKIVGLEVLLRWNHPDLGLIPPSRFIPIAEQSGQIRAIGEWVILKACEQGKKWIDQGYDFGRIAINISGLQLQQEDFLKKFIAIIKTTQMPAHNLELEVTETFLMKSTEHAINALRTLMNLGIHISIDDFGTGYSSMSYLKKLPVTNLKIDQSFIRDITGGQDNLEIVKAIIAIAKAMKIQSIAEGIETENQLKLLRGLDCTFGQGYLISKPLPPQEVSKLIAGENSKPP